MTTRRSFLLALVGAPFVGAMPERENKIVRLKDNQRILVYGALVSGWVTYVDWDKVARKCQPYLGVSPRLLK